MPLNDQRFPPSSQRAPGSSSHRPGLAEQFSRFERRQSELWRLTFVILFVLGLFFAWTNWDTIRSLQHRFEALPVGLLVLLCLFGFYLWKKTQELSEMRGLLHGLEQREAAPPSDKQLQQLFEMMSRSQQGYRDLIDSFDDLLLSFDLEGRIRAANRSLADLLGVSFQELIGKPLTDFIDDEDGAGRRAVDRALPRFMERRHWAGAVRIRFKKVPAAQYFDCVAHAMTRAGEVHGITVLARDITALRENEARFTQLFESLQEGIYVVTPADAIADANPALVRMLGYSSKDELLQLPFSAILADPKERERLQDEAEFGSSPKGGELVLLRKDRAPLTCLNSITAVRDAAGRVIRYQGALIDITERREVERRLFKEQEFARRLVDGFPDLIMVLDPQRTYTFISPRIKDILGYEVDEAMELGFGDCAHADDRGELHRVFDDVVAQKTVGSLEVRVRRKQGDWRLLRCSFSPLFAESGGIEGVVIAARDVTELKRLEEKLIQSEKLAAMGQMLAGVAHELNNPLTAVLGVTELLRERPNLEDPARRQLDLAYRQARRAARIVQNLLDFSRPAAPQKRLIDLNSILERTLQLHEHALRRSNIAVDFQPDPSLPSVVGDASQLIQVFLNLVSNAEYAIREVRDSGHILVRLRRIGERVAVTVQDDGVGIRPEALPRLFDPFYTTKRPGGGTGLGLSICMSIIREHNGTIEVESTPPTQGSVFTVLLPAAEQSSLDSGLQDTSMHSAVVMQQMADILKGRSILLLDDEESIRMLLQEGLAARGLHLDTAASCEEAVAAAARIEYDAILCDWNLSTGGLTGRQAAERILAAMGSRKPPVVFITGDLISPEAAALPGQKPVFLQKPFRISDVLSTLAEVFAGVRESLVR